MGKTSQMICLAQNKEMVEGIQGMESLFCKQKKNEKLLLEVNHHQVKVLIEDLVFYLNQYLVILIQKK
jgi:hypothetical protein